MDEVISLSDESEEEARIWRKKRRRKRKICALPAQDIIDLTGNDKIFAHVTRSDEVIDLISDDDTSHGTLQQQMKSDSKYIGSLSEGSDPESEVIFGSPMSEGEPNLCNSEDLEFDDDSRVSSFTRAACGSLHSAESKTDLCQPVDGLPGSSDAALPSKSDTEDPCGNSSCLQAIDNQDCKSVHLETGIHVQHITISAPAAMQEDPEEASSSRPAPVSRTLVYKLRHFKKPPLCHLFSHTLRRDQNSQPAAMPLTRMNIVNNTKDEGFHQGTLYFLSEFVSANHYPPKDLISHVINSVLLGAEDQATRHEAYMVLMKVQRLHPATSASVAWEWKLLSEVMSKQENQTCHLFLQYVVQTLDDDFHLCLQRRTLQKCLCKSMLSCDKSFYNVKQVIDWLIDSVKLIAETTQNSSSQCNLQRVLFLLQRMLSMAVEVDNSPTMNSNKIANYIFPYVTILKTRQQREMFFKTTENILLRAKILEVIFHHSCESLPPPELSLSFGKILYFIKKSTLQLENQGPDWQRWDEMLHHITVLCLSLQTVITGHLRTPVIDRPDEILKGPQNGSWLSEDITESEVNNSLTLFQQRASPGAEPAAALLNRLFLLRSLLQTAVKR